MLLVSYLSDRTIFIESWVPFAYLVSIVHELQCYLSLDIFSEGGPSN